MTNKKETGCEIKRAAVKNSGLKIIADIGYELFT
jgi:hypothetical protein